MSRYQVLADSDVDQFLTKGFVAVRGCFSRQAAEEFTRWSESYDRDLTDIFIVQDEISHKIADKLRAGMAQNALVPEAVTEPTKNIEAYNLFLKGLHYYNKLTPADAYKAIDYLEKAIALEPDFARAYACIAGA